MKTIERPPRKGFANNVSDKGVVSEYKRTFTDQEKYGSG